MDESEQIELKGSFILKKPFFYQPSNWMEFFKQILQTFWLNLAKSFSRLLH
jgi:hypothetical protein